MNEVRGGAVDTDAAGAAAAGDDIGLQTGAIAVVNDLYAFAGIDIGGFHECLVDRDRTDILEVSLCHLYAVNLGFQYV